MWEFCVRRWFNWIWFLRSLDDLSSALVHSNDCYYELLIEAQVLFEASRLGRKFLFDALWLLVVWRTNGIELAINYLIKLTMETL